MEPENDFDPASRLPRARWDSDDEALAYYLTTARYGGNKVSSSVQAEMEAITHAAKQDPDLAARIDALVRRLEILDGEAPQRTFERLSNTPAEARRGSGRARQADRRASRHARRYMRPWTAAATLALLIFAVGSMLISQSPEFADLARIEPLPAERHAPTLLRGGSATDEAVMQLRLGYAQELLVNAEMRLLGRVVRYEDQKVDEALQLLVDLARSTDQTEAHTRARYLYAKGLLMKGNATDARRLLEHAENGPGDDASRAARLLTQLRSRGEG